MNLRRVGIQAAFIIVSVPLPMILVIWIPSGVNRPYSVPADMFARLKRPAFYVRSGTSSIEAKGEVLEELRELANRIPFDDRGNPNITYADINLLLIREYLRKVNSRLMNDITALTTEQILDQLDLLVGPAERRMIKNVVAMMFCDYPERFFPYTQIDVCIFPEGKIRNPNRFSEVTFKGAVPQIISRTLDYLKTIVVREYVIKPKDRAESIRYFNYPYQALEEAVTNSMYHRDYQEYEPVEITIEPDRITFLSYSGPDRSISAEAIRRGNLLRSRRYRNRRLGDFLKELELTEGRSTGIPTIQDELKKNGSPRATIETDDDRSYFLMDIPVHEGCGDQVVLNNEQDVEQDKSLINNDIIEQEQVAEQVVNKLRFIFPDLNDYRVITKILFMLLQPKSLAALVSEIGCSRLRLVRNYLIPLSAAGLIEMTIPDKPKSRNQKYRVTSNGLNLLNMH